MDKKARRTSSRAASRAAGQETRKSAKRSSKKTSKKILIVLAILVVVLGAIFAGVYFKVKSEIDALGNDVVYTGVTVEGMDVAGMTAEEVKAALDTKLAEHQAGKVLFTRGETQVESTLGEIGLKMSNADEAIAQAVAYGKEGSYFARHKEVKALAEESVNVDITFDLDEAVTQEMLTSLGESLRTEPKDASIKRENGAFVITDSVEGVQMDVASTAAQLVEYFNEAWEYTGDETFEVVAEVAQPKITSEMLSKIQHKLGSFTTKFTAGNDRAKNISVAAGNINGTILLPGEEMSASDSMGKRTAANGYRMAGTYLNGETVDGMGGGVCQVSTTLYGAVLRAELEITERSGHSMTVSYVKPAEDAAISDGYKDLKFKNNTNAPIYVEGYTSGGSITFTIYGEEYRPSNRKVEYVSKTLSTTTSTNKFEVNAGAALGVSKKSSGHDGKKAELWKVVYIDGKETERTRVNSTSYMMSPTIYTVGTSSSNAEASAMVKNAVGSNDLATIKSAVSAAKALEAAPPAPTTPPATEPTTPPATE